MSVRTGMADLITQVRTLIGDPVVAGTPPTSTYTDQQVQDALDAHRTQVRNAPLSPLQTIAAGGTVIMTTHILEVAERMADRIGVIAGGRLIAEGTLDESRRMTGKTTGTTATSLEDTFLTLVEEPAAPAVAAE